MRRRHDHEGGRVCTGPGTPKKQRHTPGHLGRNSALALWVVVDKEGERESETRAVVKTRQHTHSLLLSPFLPSSWAAFLFLGEPLCDETKIHRCTTHTTTKCE